MKIYENLTDLIGKTPLLRLKKVEEQYKACGNIIAKLEYFNPLGSVKDRAAFYMLKTAKENGKIKKDTVIIEPTSGNMGVGLAFICAQEGYKLILAMPETMSVERRSLLSALGAQLVLTDGAKGMRGAIEKAQELHRENKNSFMPMQFENPANTQAHEKTTAKEILEDTDGKIDIFISAFGTGGTITGVGNALKKHNKNITIIGVEPSTSAVLSGEKAGAHKIQGIGAGFIPKIMENALIDEVITVNSEDAFEKSAMLGKTDGLLVGLSSGAALDAAIKVAQRQENKDKNIVVIFPDTGERYLSTGVYNT